MENNSINIFMNICCQTTNPYDWDSVSVEYLDWDIEDLKNNFENEIESVLFGKKKKEKEDIINNYLSNLYRIKFEVLDVKYDETDKEEYKFCIITQEKMKLLFDDLIEFINQTCLVNNINLLKINSKNYFSNDKLDTTIFLEQIEHYNIKLNKDNNSNKTKPDSKIQKNEKSFNPDENLKSFFYPEGYKLFEYLIENFDKKFSNHNKFSCIYRLMIKDNYLSKETKAERFKSLIFKPPLNIDFFKYSLNQEDILSEKIIKEYKKLKKNYLKSTKGI